MAQSAFRSVVCSCTFHLHIRDGVAGEQIRADRDGIRRIIHVLHKSVFAVMGTRCCQKSVSAYRLAECPPISHRPCKRLW